MTSMTYSSYMWESLFKNCTFIIHMIVILLNNDPIINDYHCGKKKKKNIDGISGEYPYQWIGLRENLQETIDFPIKYGAFL